MKLASYLFGAALATTLVGSAAACHLSGWHMVSAHTASTLPVATTYAEYAAGGYLPPRSQAGIMDSVWMVPGAAMKLPGAAVGMVTPD